MAAQQVGVCEDWLTFVQQYWLGKLTAASPSSTGECFPIGHFLRIGHMWLMLVQPSTGRLSGTALN